MNILNKKFAGVFLALLLFVFTLSAITVIPVSAEENMPRLVDNADLLSDSEESELLDLLNEISERQQVDVVVVTVDSMDGKTAEAYADDFFDYNGYGFGDERDGILLLISMGERDCCISTSGYGITVVTDAGREYMFDIFADDLSAGNYAAVFTSFANMCDDFITQANTGEPYDVDNLPKEPFEFVGNIVVSLVIGFIISLIATGSMKRKLRTVRSKFEADDYLKPGSLQLTNKNDMFLYKNIDRRKKPENNTSNSSSGSRSSGGSKTHTSSSGRTHGGGSRKF